MASSILCLVTIHGIGFQQPPQPDLGIPGYADGLHQHLSKYLDATLLSDDPQRTRSQRGENGPIYIESCWPPGTGSREQGLARLGSWIEPDMLHVDTSSAPLVAVDARIAHIALVYSHAEGYKSRPGAALIAGAMSIFSAPHYVHIRDLLHMLLTNSLAIIEHGSSESTLPSTNLHIRRDMEYEQSPSIADYERASPGGLLTIIRHLENDVAAYISHNDLREHVRSFVYKALLRLAARDDVEGIVINAHSNGTVIALDVMRQLPPFAAAKIQAFVTAGSPLRKYVALFRWGQQIEMSHPLKLWLNFWDEHDPVADPLEPPISWRRGDDIPSACDPKLFLFVDPNTGDISNINIKDIKVDNLTYSRQVGFQAHNYWDNEEEFVKPLAKLLASIVRQQLAVPSPQKEKS
jgi:hypothetical protein